MSMRRENLPPGDEPNRTADGHHDLLGEISSDAALERSDFLVQSTEQLRKFLDRHRERIATIGGLTLIDEEPDYLSIAPDLTFRSRSRYQDDVSGEWISETEVIESAAELVELYNPADLYAWFSEAAREAAGLGAEPTAEADVLEAAGIGGDEAISLGDPYAEAADSWAAGQTPPLELTDDESAARRLYDIALEYQERSQRSEGRLLAEFEAAAASASSVVGDLVIVDDDDERLVLTTTGEFRAEVVPEEADGEWRTLSGPEELVEFYDPTDVFGDLADAIAEAFPSVAPEFAAAAGADAEAGGDGAAGGDATPTEDVAEADAPDAPDDAEDRPTA